MSAAPTPRPVSSLPRTRGHHGDARHDGDEGHRPAQQPALHLRRAERQPRRGGQQDQRGHPAPLVVAGDRRDEVRGHQQDEHQSVAVGEPDPAVRGLVLAFDLVEQRFELPGLLRRDLGSRGRRAPPRAWPRPPASGPGPTLRGAVPGAVAALSSAPVMVSARLYPRCAGAQLRSPAPWACRRRRSRPAGLPGRAAKPCGLHSPDAHAREAWSTNGTHRVRDVTAATAAGV